MNRDYDALNLVYSYKSFARLKYFLELGYSEQDWKDALSSLQARGLLTKAGALSPIFKAWRSARMMSESSFITAKAVRETFFKTDLEKSLQ
jgi:hypothetical protein